VPNTTPDFKEDYKIQKPWYKKWWGLLILSLLSLFLIFSVASGIYVYKQIKIYQEQGFFGDNTQVVQTYSKSEIEGKNSYFIGSVNPEISIVEFSDYACPNCKNFYKKTKNLRTKYYGRIRIVHRDFPVIADYSQDLALAARCAGDQGLYWLAHDALYENQGISTKQEIYEVMLQIGVDGDELLECLASNKHLGEVQVDLNDGLNLGIKGTPTWFINGYRADGDMPEEMLNDIIENILINN